jgi:hypothetical protein
MSVYKATSWGRTARPKAPNNQDKHYLTGSQAANGILAATYHNLTEADNAKGIYATENQRYLHINCSGSNSGVTNVYVHLYASGRWSELQHVDLADGSRSSIVCGANQHIIVDLKGADLVSVKTGSSGGAYQNFIAFSTF